MAEKDVVTIKQDVLLAYQQSYALFNKYLERSNDLWDSTLQLTITISCTILFGSLGLLDKLFPIGNITPGEKLLLFISWIGFVFGIIFCILQRLISSDYHGRYACESEVTMKMLLIEISAGKSLQDIDVNLASPFIVYAPIRYGLVGIISFILGLVNIIIFLLTKYLIFDLLTVAICINVLVLCGLSVLIFDHFKNRSKNEK